MNDAKSLDQTTATLLGHICIRDPDSGEIIVRQRDKAIEKKTEDDR